MPGSVDIYNIGLSWLGLKPIVSFLDDTDKAEWGLLNFQTSFDSMITEREFTFSQERAILLPDATAPLFGYTYRFLLPADCLKVNQAYDESPPAFSFDDQPAPFQWVVEGRYILSNEAKMYIRYSRQVTNPVIIGPTAVQALAARLAMDACIALTEDEAKFDKMALLYINKLDVAGAVDGQQGRMQKTRSTQLTRVR